MPISKKITEQIKKTSATAAEKKMMQDLLEIEDKGVYRFEAAYEKVIKDFLAAEEKKGGKK